MPELASFSTGCNMAAYAHMLFLYSSCMHNVAVAVVMEPASLMQV